jgi:ribonucleotide monophosphatase NagD (HAD superfamily)
MGDKWFSVLVRTGVFRGGDNDEENPAKHVAANVLEAIKFIFARENFHYPEDKTDV